MKTAITKMRQFGVSLRQRGLGTTLYWTAFGYLRPNRFILLARDLTGATIRITPRETVCFEHWSAAQMQTWRGDQEALSTEFFQDAIDGVDSCAVALVNQSLAGMIWLYQPEHRSRLFHLAIQEAELNQGFVLPEFRDMKLFTDILIAACNYLQNQGCHTVYAGVHDGNQPSLQAFNNAGFVDVGERQHFLACRPKVHTHTLRYPTASPATPLSGNTAGRG